MHRRDRGERLQERHVAWIEVSSIARCRYENVLDDDQAAQHPMFSVITDRTGSMALGTTCAR
jgi:hypothetical protein